IIGQQVVNSQGQAIGEVIDMAIDKKSKDVYAVVDVGGAASGKAKGILVPVKQMKHAHGMLVANVSKQALQQAQAFNESKYLPIELDIPLREFAALGPK
ncbi:MAG: PRC-barrel domain-containing protein, partial [Pseudomonadota bacterium]|nr:PRC-barrel domain-containing protein [Pseudomonadota bacterium]